jgi:thioredoxin 1
MPMLKMHRGAAIMGAKTREIYEAEFKQEVLDSSLPVLVDFTADWCPPCKMLSPIVDEIASQYEGKIRVVKVDADYNQKVIQQYGVLGLPTLILFKGGKVVERIMGFKPKDKIVGKLNGHL